MQQQPDVELFWTVTVLLSCCLQAHLLQLLQKLHPECTMLFMFIHCAAPLVLIPPTPATTRNTVSSKRAFMQSLLFTIALILPQLAIYSAPDIASVGVATVIQSSDILFNLVVRGDRSVIRWYGATFICFGLMYLIAALEWPPDLIQQRSVESYSTDFFSMLKQVNLQASQRLTALTFIFGGVTAHTLLGIEQEKYGRVDHDPYLFASFTLLPGALTALPMFLAKTSVDCLFLLVLYFAASIFAALSLKNYQEGTRNNSYRLTYLLTLRRFITIALASLLYSPGQRYVVLLSAFFVAFGVTIVELHLAVERSKQKRLNQEQQQQQAKSSSKEKQK